MESAAVLEVMKAFFKDKPTVVPLDDFGSLSPRALLKESLDVIDFIVYLEEELGCEIDTGQIGEALMSKSFAELAVEVQQHLEA